MKVVNYRQGNDDFNILLICTFLDCDKYRTDYDGQIDTTRQKHALGIQYKHESKEDIAGFISKPVARPEYGTIYQHNGMLLQNLHHRYLYILIQLPHLLDLEQQIPSFPNCDNYGSLDAGNSDPLLDDTPTNDNELHQVICNTFKIDHFQEMDTIVKLQNRLECKINYTLPALLPNKLKTPEQGPVTSGEGIRNKQAIPALAIIQGIAAIGGMMIKGINALVDAKRASSFNNAIKLVNENVHITHDRLNLNSGYLTHHILDPKILAKYLEVVEDGLEETAPEFEPVFTNVYQYYGNSLISFTNTIDDLLLQ